MMSLPGMPLASWSGPMPRSKLTTRAIHRLRALDPNLRTSRLWEIGDIVDVLETWEGKHKEV